MFLTGLYTIKLPQFEGPFDLLLFFIERDEIDIYNIPISKITNDFLSYIKTMESLNIDLASEFIVMAASLMQIKAKMLLPRKRLNEEGEEIDPRKELIQRLLEYKRYKEAIPEFELLEKDRSKKHTRGHISIELKSIIQQADYASEMESMSLFRLMSVFESIMKKYDQKNTDKKAVILRFNYDMVNEKTTLRKWLRKQKKMNFKELFTNCKDRMQAIVRFLAVLDMINEHVVKIVQGDSLNNFWLESIDNTPSS